MKMTTQPRDDQLLLPINGLNKASGRYSLPPISLLALAQEIQWKPAAEPLTWPATTLGEVAQAGWGVILPQQADPALKLALQPLLNHRAQQLGAKFKLFDGADGYRADETAAEFLTRHGELPAYLLLVGQPTVIPFTVQQALGRAFAVGRLAFDHLDDYARYAQTVVAVETGQLTLPKRVSFFNPANPGERLLRQTARQWLYPTYRQLKHTQPDGSHRFFVETQATQHHLRRLLGGDDTPTLLIMAGHGLESLSQPEAHGALICQDWPGVKNWQPDIPPEFYFGSEQLTDEAHVVGLIVAQLSSHSLGLTGQHPISGEATGQAPGVSRLPQKLLAHPNGGALAVMGYVGPAWGQTIAMTTARVSQTLLGGLAEGEPVGRLVHQFGQSRLNAATQIEAILGQFQLVHRQRPAWVDKYLSRMAPLLVRHWLVYQNGQNFMLLGDPAVRLPLAAMSDSFVSRPKLQFEPRLLPPAKSTAAATDRSTSADVSPCAAPLDNGPPPAQPQPEPATATQEGEPAFVIEPTDFYEDEASLLKDYSEPAAESRVKKPIKEPILASVAGVQLAMASSSPNPTRSRKRTIWEGGVTAMTSHPKTRRQPSMTTASYEDRLDNPDFLTFNGINGATGEYGVLPMTEQEFAGSLVGFEVDKLSESFSSPLIVDPTDLAQSAWGIIFMDNEPRVEAIKEALTPLINLRKEQALSPSSQRPHKKTERYFKIFEGPDGYRAGESKRSFLGRFGVGSGPVDPDKGVPYYLLLVGSPEQIPYAFQVQLAVQFSVGRIHFETLDEYARYAQTVVAAERGEIKRSRNVSFFGVENSNDRATQMSNKYLIKPLRDLLIEENDDWQIDSFIKQEATKAQLTRLLGGDQTPALLFTASHGMEFPKGNARQLPHQGALLCQDWPGPRRWRKEIPQDFYFAGDDIASDANLAGLIGFHFACYGGGCPELDQYSRQSNRSRQAIAPQSFLAQLPTKMLGHPRGGALAVIAHVERAWGYSFLSSEAGQNITMFQGVLGHLLRNDPVGYTAGHISGRFAEIATDVTAEVDQLGYLKERAAAGDNKPLEEHLAKHGKTLTNLWTEHNDARDYIVLGDPAARLAVAKEGETPIEQPSIELRPAKPAKPLPSGGGGEPLEGRSSGATMTRDQPVAPFGLFGFGDEADAAESGTEQAGLRQSLQNLAQKLNRKLSNVIDDLTTLEVLTYTSEDLSATKASSDAKEELVQVNLRAMTQLKLDGDVINIVPRSRTANREAQIDKELWDTHREMVQLAQEQRIEFIKAAGEIAGTIVNALK